MSPETLAALRELVKAAAIAEKRHPNCGAFGHIRHALSCLPPELRVQVGEMPAHEEDDREDGRAEVRRLTAENIELRRRLAEARGTQLDLFGPIGGDR
ncbi:hypothetical protein O7626_41095 [Micromonospora sp. WMMD1102]|uniref:hypothetical protein n=1 Tax=Micromonospora sp. WMMD1102 TaxID=3016105 RepID=UPI002415192B|nr:hypothetical protein [Micromonospora sp. WMMD1102]MDG4784384.1 hypothetical protein [Micromonospora sp. WMMD1102]MDG4792202.1 hypothetical protein [Micromonospora sp. WMMD1102]